MPVSDAAVLVGPVGVRAWRGGGESRTTDTELVSAALGGIDDEVTLVDERPIEGAAIWRHVLESMLDGPAHTLLLVCPSWWSERRIAVVSDAASALASNVEARTRFAVLRGAATRRPSAVVEIATRFVAIGFDDGRAVKVVRRDDAQPAAVADDLASLCRHCAAVSISSPNDVGGAEDLAAMVVDRVRLPGVAVNTLDDDGLLRAAVAEIPTGADEPDVVVKRPRRQLSRAIPLGAAVTAAAVLGAAATLDRGRPEPQIPMTLLAEGRIAVKVPAVWTARRITTGPGSARLQVTSPTDAEAAVHITQSLVLAGETLADIADTLKRALVGESPDVFREFNGADRLADRSVVTYLEARPSHDIRWAVMLDGSVRISIGCQSARGREDAVRDACEQAVMSAHALR